MQETITSVTVLVAIIGGAGTVIGLAIRSFMWQLRETRIWAEAADKRADAYAQMALQLLAQRLSDSRRSGSR